MNKIMIALFLSGVSVGMALANLMQVAFRPKPITYREELQWCTQRNPHMMVTQAEIELLK